MTAGSLSQLTSGLASVAAHEPWPRFDCSEAVWVRARHLLAEELCGLLGLWGEAGRVHAALLDQATQDVAVLSLACPLGTFPSLGAEHAPAIRLERSLRDLFGLIAVGARDERPWLDHGRWAVTAPMGEGGAAAATPYVFLPVEGESLHQIPVGPVHAGIIEPGHFRFTASGDTIVRLEARLGYTHKGVEHLMAGADLARAGQIAGRVSGDSTVAYSWAFAHATEAALDVEAPRRAQYLRALMAELERLANHFGDVGAICNDAAFVLMHAHCGVLRERVLRAADACFGHRLMRDRIVPGGVERDIAPAGAAGLARQVRDWRKRFANLVDLYDETNSLEDRTVGAGILAPHLAKRFAAGGYVGRASGRNFDARKAFPYPPYDKFAFDVPVLERGDVDARVRIRMLEVEQSLNLIEQILAALPEGPLLNPHPTRSGEGMALIEGFRGDVLAWVRVDGGGRIERCHLRDPSWFQWPLLEAAIEGNIVGDFPLCNKSFNCSYSGCDL